MARSRPFTQPEVIQEHITKGGVLKLRSLYFGWVLVGALGITTIVSYGTTQYLFGVLVIPVSAAFHWSRASISGAYALSTLIAGLLGVPVGYALDQRGPRLLMAVGSLLAGFSLIGLAQVQSLWQFYLLWSGGLGVAMALTLYPVTFTVVANWFVRRRGKALAILTLLGGLASPIFIPLAGILIPSLGWRSTLVICGLFQLGIAVPLHVVLLRRSPEDLGLSPDGDRSANTIRTQAAQFPGVTVQQAVRRLAFWTLTISFALATLGSTVLFTHQVASMIDRGYDSVLAAALAGGIGLVSLPGRFVLNLLSERIAPQRLLGSCLIVQALGVIALILAPSVSWLVVYVVLYGAAFGAISPLRASVMADHFGRRAYGAITAIQGVSVALCAAGGPLAAGWLYDLLGHYDMAFWLCALGFLLAAGGVFLTPRPST